MEPVKLETRKGNLAFWRSVEKTNPNFTKPHTRYQGKTSIDPYYQIKTATAIWGPYGGKWGLKKLRHKEIMIRKGSEAGEKTAAEFTAVLSARFFYPGPDGKTIKFQISVNRPLFGEYRKALETDLITKSLSRVGFNADVFLGKFDSPEYRELMAGEFAEENKTRIEPKAENPSPNPPVLPALKLGELVSPKYMKLSQEQPEAFLRCLPSGCWPKEGNDKRWYIQRGRKPKVWPKKKKAQTKEKSQ